MYKSKIRYNDYVKRFLCFTVPYVVLQAMCLIKIKKKKKKITSPLYLNN